MLVDKNTLIDVGFPLSRNFLIEHMTTGAYHQILGQWLPKFTAPIIPRAGMPTWEMVRNLQVGAENLLERMFNGLGKDFALQSGFLNITSPEEALHALGRSIDVQILGYEDNMYSVAKEISRFTKGASAIELVYGSQSWIHIEYDMKTMLNSIKEFPTFKTRDIMTGVIENGLTSIRGFA